MTLNDIFPSLLAENTQFDCKARLNREDSLSWVKTIGGFANAKGGSFYIGVEDKTMKLIGFAQVELDSEKLYFVNEMKNHMAIYPSYQIEVIPYEIRDEVRYILKITIHESNVKPLVVKYGGYPMIFIRRDGFTSPANEEEIRLMVISSSHPSFDAALTDIDFSVDEFHKYGEFYKENVGKELKIKELESIGFVVNGKLTNGAYLFSDHYQGNRTKVVCSLYRGVSRGDDVIIASNSFEGNLIDCYRFMYEFIEARMNHGFIKLKDRREDIDSYPSRALFEAMINALAHRDYLLDGSQINVDMFANRLVISSPGSLFDGAGELSPTYDLASFSSKRRNEIISSAFVLAKAMEAKGTGLEKIMEDYAPFDKKHQPFIYSKNNTFHIVLPDLTNEEGVSIDAESIYVIGQINHGTRFDISVLAYCYHVNRSIKEIVDHLGVSNSSFFKKSVLQNLTEQGYLIMSNIGNKACYIANREKVYSR